MFTHYNKGVISQQLKERPHQALLPDEDVPERTSCQQTLIPVVYFNKSSNSSCVA